MIPKKSNKVRVRYEFFTYSAPLGSLVTQVNLKIENPASIRFVSVGPAATVAVVNNTYFLGNIPDFTAGLTPPYELILENNANEIDVTTYSLKISVNGVVNVICKYFVNE